MINYSTLGTVKIERWRIRDIEWIDILIYIDIYIDIDIDMYT